MSPLCSRNARPQKALAGRAQLVTHSGHQLSRGVDVEFRV